MKRLAAFVLLLAIGLIALKVAIGDEVAVRAKQDEQVEEPSKPRPEQQPGLRVAGGKVNTTISQSGKLVYPKKREVDLGDGRVRKETVFILRAEDSQPIGDGLQQLTGVKLELYDDDKHAVTLNASRAFLELGRGADGQPKISDSKAIDLRDTVVTSEPDSRLAGLRLELGDAKVNVGDEEIQLTTAEDQPVTLELEGRRSAKLTGRGARTRLPRSRASSLKQASVTILSDPKLTSEDVQVQAAGRMHYVEDLVSGAARIKLEERVELRLQGAKLGSDDATRGGGQTASIARGSQFTGWLLRSRERPTSPAFEGRQRGDMIWQRLVLTGATATIETPGLRVETPSITLRPGPLGEPAVITAHGGPSRVLQTETDESSSQDGLLVGRSPRRIHLVRPGQSAGALHVMMGFPSWTTMCLQQQQVVVLTDAAEVERGSQLLTASEGMLIARRLDTDSTVVQGFGDVAMKGNPDTAGQADAQRPTQQASGNDGMILAIAGDEERLRMGPAGDEDETAWRNHRYRVLYGSSSLEGAGGCEVRRKGARTELDLRAPFQEVTAYFEDSDTELRKVRRLRATLHGEDILRLEVLGLPVQATFAQGGERLRAQAPKILKVGPRSLKLLPVTKDESPWNELSESDRLPRLTRSWSDNSRSERHDAEYSVELRGPHIDVHHAGGRALIVDTRAEDDDLARVYAVLPQAASKEPATVTCAAARIRILPFVFTPETTAAHFGGGGALSGLATHTLAAPWLLVDEVRSFELDDEEQGHVEGTGRRLLISQGGASALFLGDPDSQVAAVVRRRQGQREVVLRGARVRLQNDAEVRFSALGTFEGRSTMLSPTMTLHEKGGRGMLAHMQAVCRGDIYVDPDAVRFTGPVEATSLLPTLAVDPQGIKIDAKELLMTRQTTTGDVSRITGEDVRVDWPRLGARADKVELDLLRETCVASDPRAAIITMPDGRELRSPRISVNYLTWEISTGPSSARKATADVDAADNGDYRQ